MHLLDRVLTRIEHAIMLVFLGAASLLGLMQVVLRYGFGFGFEWTEGITIALVVWASLVGASAAAHQRIHIRLDLVVDLMPRRWQQITEAGATLLCLLFVGYVLVLAVRFELFLYDSGIESLMTYLPEWLTFLGAPLALSLLFLRYLQTLIVVLRGGRMGSAETAE